MRFGADTSASISGPDGFSLSYSSAPNQAATQEAFAAINRLAGLVGTVAAGRPPIPLAPSQPAPPADEDDAAFLTPRARPPLIDGVAHALEL